MGYVLCKEPVKECGEDLVPLSPYELLDLFEALQDPPRTAILGYKYDMSVVEGDYVPEHGEKMLPLKSWDNFTFLLRFAGNYEFLRAVAQGD